MKGQIRAYLSLPLQKELHCPNLPPTSYDIFKFILALPSKILNDEFELTQLFVLFPKL